MNEIEQQILQEIGFKASLIYSFLVAYSIRKEDENLYYSLPIEMIAKYINISRQIVRTCLNNLEKKGYISKIKKVGKRAEYQLIEMVSFNQNLVTSNQKIVSFNQKIVRNNQNLVDFNQFSDPLSSPLKEKEAKRNNPSSISQKENSLSYESLKEKGERAEGDSNSSSQNQVPTMDEVQRYVVDNFEFNEKLKTEADKFYDYYQGIGWKSGGYEIKDWKAVLRNWIRKVEEKEKEKSKDESSGNIFLDLLD